MNGTCSFPGADPENSERGGRVPHHILLASSPFGSHAIFILGDIYLGLARDLGASRERIGAGAR